MLKKEKRIEVYKLERNRKKFFCDGRQKRVKDTQALNNDAFSEKWAVFSEEGIAEQEKLFLERKRFLEFYGFRDEKHLPEHLRSCDYILDASCGLGYYAALFASLAPHR